MSPEQYVEKRPWGEFTILADKSKFKAKTLTVEVNAKLSYQSHSKRDEHWVVIDGTAEVTLNDEKIEVLAGEHIFIPRGAKHRVKNTGSVPLLIVEVQIGEYFGEDDIVRYEDDYNRV